MKIRNFLLAAALLAAVHSAHAQSTWINSAGGDWGTTTNWDITPSFTSTGGLSTSIIFPSFGAALSTAIGGASGFDLTDGRTVGSITLNDSADDSVLIKLQASTSNTAARQLFIGGAGTITITSGSAGAHTMQGGGSLMLRSNLTVNHNGAGTFTISSNINQDGGSYGITKNGIGTLTLSANTGNVYSGGTILNQGTITLSANGRLGATTGALQVNNTNTGAGTAVQLTLATSANTTVGSLSGAIAEPTSGTNTANITTGSTGGARLFTVNQKADGTYAGTISGAGNFALGSSSTHTLTLTGDNSYTGTTTISAGTLEIAEDGDINQTSGITIASGATLRYNSSVPLDQRHHQQRRHHRRHRPDWRGGHPGFHRRHSGPRRQPRHPGIYP